jgi:hypothetical protein
MVDRGINSSVFRSYALWHFPEEGSKKLSRNAFLKNVETVAGLNCKLRQIPPEVPCRQESGSVSKCTRVGGRGKILRDFIVKPFGISLKKEVKN